MLIREETHPTPAINRAPPSKVARKAAAFAKKPTRGGIPPRLMIAITEEIAK
jgi:hypothetical protein